MAQSISPVAIEKGTGKPWAEWLAFFDSIHAENLPHKLIAEKAADLGGAPNWWAQMVTVAYEQHIGRRQPGQDCTGQFNVNAAKTLPGTMDDALNAWVRLVGSETEFSNIPIERGPDITQTEKWRYWRCGLADGTRINVNIYQKAPGKAGFAIEHLKIEQSEDVEHWRGFWKDVLSRLG